MSKHKETQKPETIPPEELTKLQAENAELIETVQRLQAEFENYRKRAERDLLDARTAASDRLLTDVLPILDNLDLAIAHAKEHADPKELLTGMLMIRDQARQLLTDQNVTAIPAEGPFDPRQHEAIHTEDTKDVPSRHITKTFQHGYARGGKVLRPARVSVAK